MPTTAKLFFGSFQLGAGVSEATFNEASSSGATFSNVTDPYGTVWREARFNPGSGTLVIEGEGICELLVVGGGAGGGGGGCPGNEYTGGAGGSGGFYYSPWVYLSAQSYSVTAGAAGNRGLSGQNGNPGGSSSFGSIVTCGGGGRGSVGCAGNWQNGGSGTFGGITNGGRGAQGSAPGQGNTGQVQHNVWAMNTRLCSSGSGIGGGGGGGGRGGGGNGGPGVVIVRVRSLEV